ncbi:unnamed protein product [Spodoptera littoralis]|uniref:Chitin-binding type-2 domain-containing protein n=1 Tax=Spodoptera littoralis TaxID=7109 RepID=A0A9P0I0K2_SPOLI|nr:unnamed protein product [Spodoptera littoralis]CAH1637291.1 unnamed protein product [Spodoptera littoralis]
MCDWPVNANCHNNVDKKSHEKLTKNSNVDEICSSPDSEGVLVAHENCNEFYRCADGKPIHHQCAPGLLFNPTAMICDMPHNVNCTTEGLFISKKYMAATRANYTTDEEAATICATQNHFVYPFSHKNCNQFYVCSLGEPVVMSCQPTLFFNVDDGICDWQKNVKCGDRVIPGEEKKNGKVCSDANEGRLFGHQYCNQFYQCLGGELIQGSCPSGLYFNTFFGICDWPENVNCRNRLV